MKDHLDKIYIDKLTFRTIIGINPEERIKKQDVVINMVLYADLKEACQTDNIDQTVDYKQLKLKVMDLVENSSFQLVEKLAQAIANLALENSKVQKVKVRVDKPGALRYAKTVGIEILRFREAPVGE